MLPFEACFEKNVHLRVNIERFPFFGNVIFGITFPRISTALRKLASSNWSWIEAYRQFFCIFNTIQCKIEKINYASNYFLIVCWLSYICYVILDIYIFQIFYYIFYIIIGQLFTHFIIFQLYFYVCCMYIRCFHWFSITIDTIFINLFIRTLVAEIKRINEPKFWSQTFLIRS